MKYHIILSDEEREALLQDDDSMPFIAGWIAHREGVSFEDIQYGYVISVEDGATEYYFECGKE